MKKLLALGVFVLVQPILASDSEEQEIDRGKFFTTEDGCIIYGYDNEEDFEKAYTKELLTEYVSQLCELRTILKQGEVCDLKNLKDRIFQLQIDSNALRKTVTKSELEKLFPESYDPDYGIKTDDIVNVATCLLEHLSDGGARESLLKTMEEVRKAKEAGEESVPYPQQIIDEMKAEEQRQEEERRAVCGALLEELFDTALDS